MNNYPVFRSAKLLNHSLRRLRLGGNIAPASEIPAGQGVRPTLNSMAIGITDDL